MIAYVPAFAGSKPAGFTPGFQPRIVPSSVENKKIAEALTGAPVLLKPEILNPPAAPPLMLKTSPVGVPDDPSGSPGEGMETTSDSGVPAVLYSVDTPALLSETQNGDAPDV